MPRADVEEFVELAGLGDWAGTDVVANDYYSPFIGEFAWAPSFADYVTDARAGFGEDHDLNGSNSQIGKFHRTDKVVAQTAMRYSHGGKGFDCSLTDAVEGCVPSVWLASRMGLSWNRRNFEFVDRRDAIAAYDPAFEQGGSAGLLVAQEPFRQFLDEFELCVVWLLIGEKLRVSDRFDGDDLPRITVFRHVYALSNNLPSRASRTFCDLGHTPNPY